jgi:2-C-methyl-D-erythritol 4-phosphate cytidylyltransferase
MPVDVKKALLKLAEQDAKVLVHEVLRPLAEDYIKASPNKVDDIILPFLGQVEDALLKAVDKIDGVDGD